MEDKTFWILVKDENNDSDIKQVSISAERENFSCIVDDRQSLLESLCAQLGIICADDKVFKMRNGRGSLLPISRSLPSNTVTSPFILEVCEMHKTVKPDQKQTIMPGYNETCKKKVDTISKRVERLEKMIPDLPLLRIAKLTNEMKDVESRLSFLNARMKEAELQEWKGMFKKNPLW